MVRAIDLVTDLGSVITARNRQGVTIKDALDAIHKANKKRVSAIHILNSCKIGCWPSSRRALHLNAFVHLADLMLLMQADDELDKPYLEGFEWAPQHTEYNEEDPKSLKEMEEEWQRLLIHLSSTPGVSNFGSKKKNKKAAAAE